MKKNSDILVFSIALQGYSSLFRKCLKTQRKYCNRFGYEYILIEKSPRPLLPAEAAWLKIFLLKEALKCNYKWVAFIDADCEIREDAPSFAKEFEKYEEKKSIFMAHGFSGRINSGVIFIKKSAQALEFLENVIQNGDNEVPLEDKAPYENGHIIKYGKNNPHIKIIEAVKWNNNFSLNKKSYIQHYSGGILREQYLRESPFTRFRHLLIRRIKNKIRKKISSKKPSISMDDVHSLIPFYLRKYPDFKNGS